MGLFFQNALVDHTGVYADTLKLSWLYIRKLIPESFNVEVWLKGVVREVNIELRS